MAHTQELYGLISRRVGRGSLEVSTERIFREKTKNEKKEQTSKENTFQKIQRVPKHWYTFLSTTTLELPWSHVFTTANFNGSCCRETLLKGAELQSSKPWLFKGLLSTHGCKWATDLLADLTQKRWGWTPWIGYLCWKWSSSPSSLCSRNHQN